MSEPLYKRLRANAQCGELPMHMPGHKRNFERFPWLRDFNMDMDITEIGGFDDLNDPEEVFKELEEKMTATRKSVRSFPLVNGSTGGILAAVYAMTKPGDRILISRGCHRSVYKAAELLRLRADYIYPEVVPELGCYGRTEPEMVGKHLKSGEKYALVAITSPTYEGFISDVRAISDLCHAHGARLLVDEAHGAHLGFGGFPGSAVTLGADMVVESLHKTLPCPTQTAALHLCAGDISAASVRKAICTFQTSSPSYLLSAGIEACVRFMSERGDETCAQWRRDLEAIRSRLGERVFPNDDISKLVVPRAEYAGVRLEMEAGGYAIAYSGLGDDRARLDRFCDAVLSSGAKGFSGGLGAFPKLQRARYPFETPRGELTPLDRAEGRIAAEYLWCYPPGSPLIVPGEIVTKEAVDAVKTLINAKIRVFSAEKALPDAISCLASLDKPEIKEYNLSNTLKRSVNDGGF